MKIFNWKFSKHKAIALGIIIVSIYSLPSKAQNQITKDGDSLENITSETENNWTFTSESESLSLKDEIKALESFNISESDNLTENLAIDESIRNPQWENQGDVEDYSLEIDVYQY